MAVFAIELGVGYAQGPAFSEINLGAEYGLLCGVAGSRSAFVMLDRFPTVVR
jgi:hypothetical protein